MQDGPGAQHLRHLRATSVVLPGNTASNQQMRISIPERYVNIATTYMHLLILAKPPPSLALKSSNEPASTTLPSLMYTTRVACHTY